MPEKRQPLPPETSIQDVLVKIQETIRNPQVGFVKQAVLKNGPRTYKVATFYEIRDPATNTLHHYSLRIDSINHLKAGWLSKPENSVQLDEGAGEVKSLYDLLHAFFQNVLPDKSGEVRIIDAEEYKKLEKLLEAIPKLPSKDKLELLNVVLGKIERSPEHTADLVKVLSANDSNVLRNLSVASRYSEYKKAYQEFEKLVNNPETKEQEFQAFLEKNPWVFGSEYSETLDRRVWVRDQAVDFMVRRTTDGYLELVEIKRAFKEKLMLFDASRKSYYPSQALSQAIGQVVYYIEKIEAKRDDLKANDGVDASKIRARIIMGRNGTPEEQNSLRSLNSHLHRIEILTYDQLCNIAQRTLSFFEQDIPGVRSPLVPEDDLPF